MGYDVSYHPISETEMKKWYFEVDINAVKEGNNSVIKKLATEYNIEDFYLNKYKETLILDPFDTVFDKFEGFVMAVIQGFFRTFYYTRGSAFSFLIDGKPEYDKYTKKWQSILHNIGDRKIFNKIAENYTSGVYISEEGVVSLLNDYENNAQIKKDLDDFYAQNIPVFIKALKAAKNLNAGLLEATEVVEPNPIDLNKSSCYSNLFNCDKEGAFIYEKTVAEQLKEITAPKPKKTFWQKLFGK